LVDSDFGGITSLHRCFSLARSADFRTLTIEDTPSSGLIHAEDDELQALFPDHSTSGLQRLAFWSQGFNDEDGIPLLEDEHLIGYAIVKKDDVPSVSCSKWHVFEAVFRKYQHRHKCVPSPQRYAVSIGGRDFSLPGVLYCQQNGLNKSCAHVAVRSLLSRRLPESDISYAAMNDVARDISGPAYQPKAGLGVEHIREILSRNGIPFRDIDYLTEEEDDPDIRARLPFHKYLYSGIESGCGGLLGFRLSGPGAAGDEWHMIPFYGHTFNKDTWAPDAERSYFNVGGGLGYIPSESWTSSFLGHDDNFGPNFCVPRLYVKPEHADYVVELLADGVRYSGVQAETMALPFLYSLYPRLIEHAEEGGWLLRLAQLAAPKVQKAILRTVSIRAADYLEHLASVSDWEGRQEMTEVIEILRRLLPPMVWVAEVSVPQLFPANERKVGEILLDPRVPCDSEHDVNYDAFLLARVPGHYFLVESVSGKTPLFMEIPSLLNSHVPLLGI